MRFPSVVPYLIAEIGGNHEGDLDTAKMLVDKAARAGVDCIKFQVYSPKSLVNKELDPDRYKHFARFTLDIREHIELAVLCKEYGVHYSASIWDLESYSELDEYIDFYKIGSGDLTYLQSIDQCCVRGKPLALSTGIADYSQVNMIHSYIVDRYHKYREREMLCIMQCTSLYPTHDDEVNLNVLDTYKALGTSIGYSDHTTSSTALIAAYCKGANILEFHFTDKDIESDFRDHKVSLDYHDVVRLRETLNRVLVLSGDSQKSVVQRERDEGHDISFRRGLFPSRDMLAGEVFSVQDLIALRPEAGTPALEIWNVVGKRVLKDCKMLETIYAGEHY